MKRKTNVIHFLIKVTFFKNIFKKYKRNSDFDEQELKTKNNQFGV